jgi:hypothetical protein
MANDMADGLRNLGTPQKKGKRSLFDNVVKSGTKKR